MNASATSRTLQYATSYTASESTTLSTATTRPPSMQPLTATEQYWAARALQAETLLAAQEVHQRDIRFLGHEQEMKRQVSFKQLESYQALTECIRQTLLRWPKSTMQNMPRWKGSWFVMFSPGEAMSNIDRFSV